MTKEVNFPSRTFQLWSYTVSMRRLLLRSVKSENEATRIDVLFQNVEAVQLPVLQIGLTAAVIDGGASNFGALARELKDKSVLVFSIKGDGWAGYVAAGALEVSEDTGEYYEPSSLWPDSTDSLR